MSSDAKADAIPQELMDEARKVADEIMSGGPSMRNWVEVLARALYAERKRAADIARNWSYPPVNTAEGIATAILTYKEPSDG